MMEALWSRIVEYAQTPQGLILLVLGGFIVLTLLITALFLRLVRAVRRPKSVPHVPNDPLTDLPQGKGPIGLARLRDAEAHRRTEPVVATDAEPEVAASARETPSGATAPAFAYAAPEIAPHREFPVRQPLGELLLTLPFRAVPGLATDHAELCGMMVEAVFFDPARINSLAHPIERLCPFLPPEGAELLWRETDRATFRAGDIYAQPDAVIRTASGLLSIEYKSKGGRSDDPTRWKETMREKDLLQTLINALVLSKETGEPAAALLRTHNAVYFLRPDAALTDLIERSVGPALGFLEGVGTERPGISSADLAHLLIPPVLARWPKPRSAGGDAGEAAHLRMLG